MNGATRHDGLILPAAMAEAIIGHAQEGFPQEVCGLIAGSGNSAMVLHRGENVSSEPRVAFELDPATLALQIGFEEAGLDLVAIYHSHPYGPATPSESDIAMFYYPESACLVCSLADPRYPVLRGFRIRDGQAYPVDLRARAGT